MESKSEINHLLNISWNRLLIIFHCIYTTFYPRILKHFTLNASKNATLLPKLNVPEFLCSFPFHGSIIFHKTLYCYKNTILFGFHCTNTSKLNSTTYFLFSNGEHKSQRGWGFDFQMFRHLGVYTSICVTGFLSLSIYKVNLYVQSTVLNYSSKVGLHTFIWPFSIEAGPQDLFKYNSDISTSSTLSQS